MNAEVVGWMLVIRNGEIIWDPDPLMPLHPGDIWMFRCQEQFVFGIFADPIKNGLPNKQQRLILSFTNSQGAHALVKAVRYLLGESNVRDE